MEYEYYVNQFKGQAIAVDQWPALQARARALLERYKRDYRVMGDADRENMAVCAMAEVMDYYAAARSGHGGMRYASVGTVSVSGKGIYAQMDISPDAESRELYRSARQYLQIERGR